YNNTPPKTPNNPTPANETTFSRGNKPSKLSWSGGDVDNDTVTYTIYLRKGNSTLNSTHIQGNTTSTSYSISVDWSSTYYWKIVATDEHGATREGPVWWFKTGAAGGGGGVPPPPMNQPPVANANGPYSGYVGFAVSFDGSGSYDVDGVIVNYTWSFGDGDIGYGEKMTHVYTTAGTYTVSLTVEDNLGAASTNTTTVTVTEKPSAKKSPVAKADGPYHGLTNQSITFDGSASYDTDGSIVNWTWSFGDGTKGYGVKPTHVYTTAGTFNVTLTVTDNDGLTNTTKTTATIEKDSDGDGWSDQEEEQYGTDPNDLNNSPIDTDGDHIPDPLDSDDDNDGLPDDVEEAVDSDSKNETSFTEATIDNTTCYLIDTDNDAVYDTFYDTSTGTTTAVTRNSDGSYSIDEDGDGSTDYVYDPASGATKPYEETPSQGIPWIILLVMAIAVAVIALITYLYKEGYI
ncbi:MAG: PKD domain-containing protein, partial [Thermoplasmata archaeon]